MSGWRNEVTGPSKGTIVQVGRVEQLTNTGPVELVCARPLDVGDLRLKDDLPRTLPDRTPHCVGRTRELGQLIAALRGRRHVQLHGPRGIGKTTLIRHAVHTGVLTADAVPECQVIVQTSSLLPDADAILRAVLDECYDYPQGRAIPPILVKRLLDGISALVVVDDPLCSADDLDEVLGAMPNSVFVVATDRSELGGHDVRVSLGGLPVKASREVLRARFDGRLSAAERKRVNELCAGYEHHPGKVALLGAYLAEARRHLMHDRLRLGTDEADLIVPRMIGWLDEPVRAAVLTVAALDKAEWGWPVLAAVAGIPTQGTAEILRDTKLVAGDERFRVTAGVAELIPEDVRLDVAALTGRIVEWVTETVDAERIAAEITVIEQALRVNLKAVRHDLALALARVAAAKLVSGRHWSAWGRVLPLGLRAAIGAESVRDQVYFRYSIAARKCADGRLEEAFELVVALASEGLDGVDEATAERVRRLADQVGYRLDPPAEPVTGLLGLLRQAQVSLLKVPTPVQQFVVSHPQVLRAAGVVSLVSAIVAALVTSSGHVPSAVAADPDGPVVTATTAPGSPPTTGSSEAPPNGTTPTTGVTTTGGPTNVGSGGTAASGSTNGGGGGGQPGDGGAGTTPSPPPSTLSWGFGLDDMLSQTTPGKSHPLDSGPYNGEANWTWGMWDLGSPPPGGHPTATHMATGWDQISLPAIGTAGGTVIVTAFDFEPSSYGSFCQPSGFGPSGAAEIIDVHCFTKTGAPTDTRFLVLFAAGSGANPIASGGTRSYVVDPQPSAGVFTPDWQHGRNAGAVTRTGVGRYTAVLTGAGTGAVELAAISTDPRHCSVVGRGADSVDIACVTLTGSPVDTAFAASVANSQNFLDDKRKPVGDTLVTGQSQWGPATYSRTKTGKYRVDLANGYTPSTMHVTAEGAGNYCMLEMFNENNKDRTTIYPACYSIGGTPADSAFDLLYASTRVY